MVKGTRLRTGAVPAPRGTATPPHALATAIAYAADLLAHELLTFARPDEQPPDRRPAHAGKFAGRPERDYAVVGKGGLVGIVRLPHNLADRLVDRRSEPARVTDPGVHYVCRYDIGAGRRRSASFSAASKRALGWSTGAHGCRHAYAEERMRELQRPASARCPRDR